MLLIIKRNFLINCFFILLVYLFTYHFNVMREISQLEKGPLKIRIPQWNCYLQAVLFIFIPQYLR